MYIEITDTMMNNLDGMAIQVGDKAKAHEAALLQEVREAIHAALLDDLYDPGNQPAPVAPSPSRAEQLERKLTRVEALEWAMEAEAKLSAPPMDSNGGVAYGYSAPSPSDRVAIVERLAAILLGGEY